MQQKIKTYKAGRTDWRENVLKALNMNYTVVNDIIIYKGALNTSLVCFLVDKRIELKIDIS